MKRRADDGSALVEFLMLGVLILVPLVYALLGAFAVQRTAYAVTAATREAARAFVIADDGASADRGARQAIAVSLTDQRVDPDDVSLTIDCAASPCLSPGARVTVRVATTVRLPLLPSFIDGPRGIPVSATQTVVVDEFRQARP